MGADPRVVLKDLDLTASFKLESEWHQRLMEQVEDRAGADVQMGRERGKVGEERGGEG